MGFWSSLFGGTSDYEQVYQDADRAGDNETVYEIEKIMYEEHGKVYDQASESWEKCDHDEPGGNWFTRMFS